jgi:cation diffusion facilitator CzcD-associated flavoprotein CzcO
VVTSAAVKTIRRQRSPGGGWQIEAESGRSWQAPVAVVATGQYRAPIVPPWPGRDTYQGRLTHSIAYANGAPYLGQRVLVVGAGNSGAEIATDVADSGAASVAISIRTPPVIVPRDPFGMPVQRTSILMSALPAAIANRLGRLTAKLVVGDLRQYGMPMGTFAPYTTRRVPLIDVGFVEALKRGRVTLRPAVEKLTTTGVVFADGSNEPFDSIIAATGFSTGLASMLDAPNALDEHGEPRGLSGEPTAYPGLYFVGFTHSLRGHLFEANRASRRLARHVADFPARQTT